MGSLMLDCPLCCGKTFPSQKTLKYHLLSLTDNLYCPECSLRFDSLSLLVEHLGDVCGQFVQPMQSSIQELNKPDKIGFQDNKVNTSEKTKTDSSVETTMNLDLPEEDEKGHCDQAASDLDGKQEVTDIQKSSSQNMNLLNVKDMEGRLVSVQVLKSEKYDDENTQDIEVRLLENSADGSILILSNTQGDNDEQLIQTQDELLSIDSANADVQMEDAQSSDEMYSCNSCGVSFTSVIDHIQNYHNDQEVVVEMTDEDGVVDDSVDDVEFIHVSPNGEDEAECDDQETVTASPHGETRRILMQSGDIVTTQASAVEFNDGCSNERWRAPQILNTLREEECLDRDGRWYTRKVVQIERFWDPTTVKIENSTEGSILGVKEKLSDSLNADDDNEEAVSVEAFLKAEVEMDAGDSGISRVYHCTGCLTQFLTMPEFESHDCAGTHGKYKCDHCPIAYNNSKSLCAHMKVHKGLKSNEKKVSVKQNNGALGEDDSNQNRLVGPFKCTVCDTVFPSNKSLRLHRRMHDPVRSRPMEGPVEYPVANENSAAERFHCLQCDKWIHVGYKRIHETVHTGETEYNCDICNRKFYTKENLAMHMNVHNIEKVSNVKSERTLPYECNYCNRQFARPHEKVKHERIHTGEKPHSCEICGKTFRVSYCLTLHMRTHTGARPYICNHCGKRFKAHSVYNHHMLTHSDVRAYKCPYCPKAFKTSVQLAGHKNSHTKPFSCTECNRPFASLYAVRVHMETHKRQNNLKFICKLCGASYARAFALRDHLKALHYIVEDSEEPEANAAALSILPKEEKAVEVEKLVTTNCDGEIELNVEYNSLSTEEEIKSFNLSVVPPDTLSDLDLEVSVCHESSVMSNLTSSKSSVHQTLGPHRSLNS